MSFDKMFYLTAEVYLNLYNNISVYHITNTDFDSSGSASRQPNLWPMFIQYPYCTTRTTFRRIGVKEPANKDNRVG